MTPSSVRGPEGLTVFNLCTNILVYQVMCDGPCKCESFYQGKKDLLLNVNNRYLVHYGLLYEYSELMRAGRNPLFEFVRYT